MSVRTRQPQVSLVGRALRKVRGTLIGVSLLSGIINVLALTGSFYMLQIYDRVLSSYSVATLMVISALAAWLFLLQGLLDVLRSQILVRVGNVFDSELMPKALAASQRLPIYGTSEADSRQPVRDVDTIRGFLGSPAPAAISDLPWFPIYLAFVFILHPWLGWLATIGVAILVVITLVTERVMARHTELQTRLGLARQGILDAGIRNAEVTRAMGFQDRVAARFNGSSRELIALQARTSDITGSLSGLSKVLRAMLQSAVLGLGGYLTIKGQMSAGAIIAASIAASRALAPIEMAIAHWRTFVAARQSGDRLGKLLATLPPEPETIELKPPRESLRLNGVTVAVPGTQRIILSNAGLDLKAGQALGVIGPSAAGKSTLARAIVGVWPLLRGSVRLDGAALEQWSPEQIGRHIGYLPQAVELFEGTIAENISRFESEPDEKAVIAAAEAAGCHGMITNVPGGYGARIGPGGTMLSAGQRQRIGLARALYKEPFLVVLDEPNSNLDHDGEVALAGAVRGVRQRGGIVVLVAHRPSVLAACDMAAFVANGQISSFGPRDEVLKKVLRVGRPPEGPVERGVG